MRDPSFASKVGHLYVMGGGEGNITPAAEYNFFVDPEAAKIVLNAGFPLTLFTWTLTKSHGVFDDAKLARIAALGTPLAEFFGQVNRKAREFDDKVNHLGGSTHPDSMVAAAIVEPSLVLADGGRGRGRRDRRRADARLEPDRHARPGRARAERARRHGLRHRGVLRAAARAARVSYLPPTRELRVRLDTAQALTRLFYREQAVVLACGRWIRHAPSLDHKAELGRTAWESALAADALRERVFELRYPTRFLDEQAEELSLDAADELRSMLAELRDDYADYLQRVDELADGPSRRLVEAALRDKERQIEALSNLELSADDPARDPALLRLARSTGRTCSTRRYPYGEGVALQLRSAVSHLNEVWAVETAGRILDELSPELGWEFTHQAARWLYDETRHMLMGKERLARWGFEPAEIPLGGYIYEAWQHEDPSTASGCSGTSRRRTSGASASAPPRSTRWATRRARPTWSSTGRTRRCTPSTGAAGCGRCSRRAARTPSRGPRCSSAASSSSGERVARATPRTRADPRLRRRAGRGCGRVALSQRTRPGTPRSADRRDRRSSQIRDLEAPRGSSAQDATRRGAVQMGQSIGLRANSADDRTSDH